MLVCGDKCFWALKAGNNCWGLPRAAQTLTCLGALTTVEEEEEGNTSEVALFVGDGELQRGQLLPVRQTLCGLRCTGRFSMLARLSAGRQGRITCTQLTPDECAWSYCAVQGWAGEQGK